MRTRKKRIRRSTNKRKTHRVKRAQRTKRSISSKRFKKSKRTKKKVKYSQYGGFWDTGTSAIVGSVAAILLALGMWIRHQSGANKPVTEGPDLDPQGIAEEAQEMPPALVAGIEDFERRVKAEKKALQDAKKASQDAKDKKIANARKTLDLPRKVE